MSEQTRQLAERIARDLFTNGAGHHALRLDLFIGEGRHFGGWSEVGLANRVEKFLAEAAGASVPQEAARDVCKSCGHYRETHHNDVYPHSLLQRCDGWMPAPAPACRCKQFVPRLTGEASSAPQGEQEDQATRADRRGLSERFGTAGADLDYSREWMIADYLREYDRCVEGLTSMTPREYFAGALKLETRR